jgi:hypothetical protein
MSAGSDVRLSMFDDISLGLPVEIYKANLDSVAVPSLDQVVNTLLQGCYKVDEGKIKTTHAKISHLVPSLPTSRKQVVFALLVPSCQQLWNDLLTVVTSLTALS